MKVSSKAEKVEIFVNTLNHSFIAITTFYLTWYCFHVGFTELITFHVWLTTIGYQLLMAEGILAMYKRNTLTLLAKSKGQKTIIHWILQTSGGVLATVGIIIQIISRFRLGKPHFNLIHSIIGSEMLYHTIFMARGSNMFVQVLKIVIRNGLSKMFSRTVTWHCI